MDWAADVLPGFVAAPVGAVTVIRPDAVVASPRAALLHVHGYNDYFYQAEFARWASRQGLAFYAVDMRRAGRSLLPGEHPHDMASLAEQGEDIQTALEVIAAEHPGLPIVVHGHSTGGLAAAVWAADAAPTQLTALVLNSPLFGLAMTRRDRAAMLALPVIVRVRPGMIVGDRPAIYAKHLHVSGGGPAAFDTAWKTPRGVPTTARWIAAVNAGWRRIAAGLAMPVPTLVAHSDSCGPERDDNPRIMEQDVVIDTEAIVNGIPRLGPRARELVVPGGIHDLTQSAPAARAQYLAAVAAFIDEVLA